MKFILLISVLSLGIYDIKCNWWEDAFYQIYPRSFKDSNGDGIGDLRGIIDNLEYVKDLGIDSIWINPFFASPRIDGDYDVSDYYSINPDYGNMNDFEDLIKRANELSLKIIIDLIPNHSSDEHDWFQKSINRIEPYTNYYVWHAGKQGDNGELLPPNNWKSLRSLGGLGNAWTLNEERGEFYYHKYHEKQPDFNYREPKVIEEFEKIMKFWLDKGVFGFRIDAVSSIYEVNADDDGNLPDEPTSGLTNDTTSYKYLDHIYTIDQNETFQLIYKWRKFIDDYVRTNGGEPRILMTESYSNLPIIKRYFKDDDGTEGAHLAFNFELIKLLNENSNTRDIMNAIKSWIDEMPASQSANWLIGNHDKSRAATRYGRERIQHFNALITLLPGASISYYGEEIGMTDVCVEYDEITGDANTCKSSKAFTRDFCRSPLQWNSNLNSGFSNSSRTWLPIAENYRDRNIQMQKETNSSHLYNFRKLLELKKSKAVTIGEFKIDALDDNVLMLRREIGDEEGIIAFMNINRFYCHMGMYRKYNFTYGDLKIEIIKGNSLHKVGSIVNFNDLKFSPYDLIIASYNNSIALKVNMFMIIITIMLSLIK